MPTLQKVAIKVICIILTVYCILSVIRSLGLFYLVFKDEHFFEFNAEPNIFHSRRFLFNKAYYYIPYIIGLAAPFLTVKWYKTRWFWQVIGFLAGFFVFWSVDATYVRPFFSFFYNIKINIAIVLLTALGTINILFFYKKKL